MLPTIRPMRLRWVKEPFNNPDYIFKLKHDGFRAVVYLQNGECKLVSRNSKRLRFDALEKALAELPVQNAILDGEIVCLDERGVSQFNQLFARKGEPVLYAFDLLWLDGEYLRQRPMSERFYAQHVEGCGQKFFEEICRLDLEGIVAKRKLSTYREDGNGWLKIKNRAHSQAEGQSDMMFPADRNS